MLAHKAALDLNVWKTVANLVSLFIRYFQTHVEQLQSMALVKLGFKISEAFVV